MNKIIFSFLIFSFFLANAQDLPKQKTRNYLPAPAREALFDFSCATVIAATAIFAQKWGKTAGELALDLKNLPKWQNNDMFQFFLTEQFLIGHCICLGMAVVSVGFLVRGIGHTLQIFTNPLPLQENNTSPVPQSIASE